MINSGRYGATFCALTVSQVFSKLSDRALLVGVSWYLLNDYSKNALVLYLMLSMLPHLIMTFFSGKIINKYSPIESMRFSELCRAGIIGLLGLTFIVSLSHGTALWVIITAIVLANFFAAVFNPALLTVPKQLVLTSDKYQRISALLSSSASIARMVGPILTIPLYMHFGIDGVILSCFGLYLLAWLVELVIKSHDWVPPEFHNLTKKDYLVQLIKHNKMVIQVLAVFFLINLVVIPIQLFMPLYAKDIFHSDLHVLAIFESALGFGLLVGGSLIVFFHRGLQ